MGIDWQGVQDETVELLRCLLRFDTTNPPGNEIVAARYIAGVLAREGISAQVLEAAPGRGNVIARLSGSANDRTGGLLLLSHLDVVPAEPERWHYPPFDGTLADGYVWGRGALDIKQLTAMELMTVLLLHRQGIPLRRDVVLAATADEEIGGDRGIGWLLEEHPNLLACAYAINEGGGQGLRVGDHCLYLCQTAEKGVCWIQLTARGETGHAALPHNDNAIEKLGRALGRLGPSSMPIHLIPLVREMMDTWLEALGPGVPSVDELLAAGVYEATLAPYFGTMARPLNAMLRNTTTPTMIEGGVRINVIPGQAQAQLDGRILPGVTQEQVVHEIRRVIGDDIDISVRLYFPASTGGADHALFRTIEDVMAEIDPGSQVLPYLLGAVSDARHLMRRGVKVCGFAPMRDDVAAPMADLVHSDNERISVTNLGFGVQALYRIVERFCTGAGTP